MQKVITGAVVYGAVLLSLKEKLSWMIVGKFEIIKRRFYRLFSWPGSNLFGMYRQ